MTFYQPFWSTLACRAQVAAQVGAPFPRHVFIVSTAASPRKQLFQLAQWSRAESFLGYNVTVKVITKPEKVLDKVSGREMLDLKMRCKTDCRAVLFFKFLSILEEAAKERYPAIFFVEDDVVLHDEFRRLFPLYWKLVPSNYEVVLIGQLSRDGKSMSRVRPLSQWPFALHFVSLSLAGVKRLLLFFKWMLRKVKNGYKPADDEFVPDLILIQIYEQLLTDEEKKTWLAFESTETDPASFDHAHWVIDNHWRRQKNCTFQNYFCRPECFSWKPLLGTGLAFQLQVPDPLFPHYTERVKLQKIQKICLPETFKVVSKKKKTARPENL